MMTVLLSLLLRNASGVLWRPAIRDQSFHGIDECVKVLLYLRGFSFDSPIAILESWRFAS